MNWSKLRTVLLVLLLVALCGAAFFTIRESQWPDPSLEAQIQRLQSVWASRRREAAADLAQFTSEADRVVPELLKALHDPDRTTRANALASLQAMGSLPADAAPVLVDVFQHDPDSKIRQEAAPLLALSKDQSAAVALGKAIDDPDPGVRLAAINALSLQGTLTRSGQAIDKLIALLDEKQPEEVRLATLQTLGSIAREQEHVARVMTEVLAKDPSPTVRNSAAMLTKLTKFGFELPALIAALDDPSPQVRLTAGAGVAVFGLSDDRTVPALCRAARHADEMTRESIGVNIGMLRFDAPPDGSSMEQATRRFLTAVQELTSLLENKESAGRDDTVIVLSRVAASYQQSSSPALLKPARQAIQAVRARVLDENEDPPLRLHAMNHLWSAVQPFNTPPLSGRRSLPPALPPGEQLHPRAYWLATLAMSLKSPSEPIRDRAVEILQDSMRNPRAEDWYRDAWRGIVPNLAEATASKDGKVRGGALAILSWLGPEAVDALGTLKTLARDSQDSALRLVAEGAIRSISVKEGLTAKDPATRIAAAETFGRLGWRAGPALPALIAAFKDPDARVRLAVISSMRSLGHASEPAMTTLATALPDETSVAARVAIIEALETVAPGARPVIDAHLKALHDPDPQVRKAAAAFQKVPADDSLIAALETALGDADDQVRLSAARSLSGILFENPTVVPALAKALGDETQRKAVLQVVDEHLEKVAEQADFARVRGNLAGLQTTFGLAIPALRDALNIKNDEVSIRVSKLLGRIVAFSHLSGDPGLHKAIVPALETYLLGLESSNPEVCQEVLAGLEEVPIRRADIVSALLKYLQRPDQSEEDHQAALLDLAAQSAFAKSDSGLLEALKPAVPILLKAVGSPAIEARQAAVEALGHIGSEAKTAEETLRGLARNDPQSNVRKAAANAVQAINGIAKKPASEGPGG